MATTRLMPLHIGKGRTIAEAITDSTDYAENPLKTEKGELVTGFECDPHTADLEFLLSKRQYRNLTGRDQGDRDVIAYHTRQSFRPGEISPEKANELGCELAMRFTKGKHAYIVATHTDKAHIHNHIIFNSTALDCRRKFRNFIGSAFAVRRISDHICLEHGLSIVEKPNPSRGSYGTWLGDDRPPSFKTVILESIDATLEQKPSDFDAFLLLLKEKGVEARWRGKQLRFFAPGQEKPTRCDTLGTDYTEEAIRERISDKCVATLGRRRTVRVNEPQKPSLLIDIQAKIQAGKGPGYERWAKVFNLKSAARTLIYLQEHGMTDYNALAEKTTAVTAQFNSLSDRMKELETRLTANVSLQKHIVNYSKTCDVYVAYRKAGYSKKFKETHEADILLHQAAKKAFDDLGVKKLPTVASLRAAYTPLLEEKKKIYHEYQQVRSEMRELLVVKDNVDRLLNLPEHPPEREPGEHHL